MEGKKFNCNLQVNELTQCICKRQACIISVQAHIRYDMSVGRETKDGGEWGLRGGWGLTAII